MTHIEKEITEKYYVIDEGQVKEFDSLEDAEKFEKAWNEFKAEINRMMEKIFREWDDGIKIKFEWCKKENGGEENENQKT